jgi:hypothetical protein
MGVVVQTQRMLFRSICCGGGIECNDIAGWIGDST